MMKLFFFFNFFKFIYFIYVFLAVLGLRCCTRAFSSCGSRALQRQLSSCDTWA